MFSDAFLLALLKYWPSRTATIKINFSPWGMKTFCWHEMWHFLCCWFSFFFKASEKPVQVYVHAGHKDFIYGFIFVFFSIPFYAHKKGKKKEKFTWIASALRLIYLHLLPVVSSPKVTTSCSSYDDASRSDSKIYVRYQLEARGLIWAGTAARPAIINGSMFVQINSKMMKRIHLSISIIIIELLLLTLWIKNKSHFHWDRRRCRLRRYEGERQHQFVSIKLRAKSFHAHDDDSRKSFKCFNCIYP